MKTLQRIVCILLLVLLLIPGSVYATDVPEPHGDSGRPPGPHGDSGTPYGPHGDSGIPRLKELSKEGNVVIRLAGSDRYETARRVSVMWSVSEKVVIASGENFSDALFAGPLASQIEAPLLLTTKDDASKELIMQLRFLKTKFVYLVGGESAISADVQNEIESEGFKVIRIAGGTRHQTAKLVSEYTALLMAEMIDDSSKSIEVSGAQFPDALSAGPYVYQYRLHHGMNYFVPYLGEQGSIVIGGTQSVPTIPGETRIAGTNRYATAVAVANEYKALLAKEQEVVVLVNGTRFEDALAAVPLATMYEASILLATPDALPEETEEFITSNPVRIVLIVGGENSVSRNVENEVLELMEQNAE